MPFSVRRHEHSIIKIIPLCPTTQRQNTQPKPDYCSDTRMLSNTNQHINSHPTKLGLIT